MLAYGSAALSKEVTSRRGKRASGRSAVIATGTVSVAHHIAIRTATEATSHPTSLKPEGGDINCITRNINIPIENPFFLYAAMD